MRALTALTTLLLLSLSLFVTLAHGISFQLEDNRKHCFLEDLHIDSNVLISYEAPHMDQIPHALKGQLQDNDLSGASVSIKDPFGNILKAENLDRSRGVVHFKSLPDVSGLYEICFQNSKSSWLGKAKSTMMTVKIELDDDAQEYKKIESKDRLEKLAGLLDKLRDKVKYVSNDQSYMKAREKRFHHTTEHLHSRIYWIAFLQAVTFTAVGVWQSYSLKNFFKSKKLV